MREISTPLAPTGSARMRATIQYERMFVLHADADAFFASVEQRDDPRLRGRPVIVGGGVVLAASYEAKAYGIRTAMGGRTARRLCHAVPAGRELAFLHPRPVECVWGVGPATAKRLQAWNVRTVGELAALSESTLVAMLGRAVGRQLSALAHNRDFRRVEPGRRRGSIGSQRALGRGRHSAEAIDAALVGIVDRITRRLRAARRVGRTVVLRLRFGDFERATRSHTLPFATANTQAILVTARALLPTATPLIE